MDGLGRIRSVVEQIRKEDSDRAETLRDQYQETSDLVKKVIEELKQELANVRKMYKIDELIASLRVAFDAESIEERMEYQVGNGYHNLITDTIINFHKLGGNADKLRLFVELTLQMSRDIQARGNLISLGYMVGADVSPTFWIRGSRNIPGEGENSGYSDHTVVKVEIKRNEMVADTVALKALEAFEAKDNYRR